MRIHGWMCLVALAAATGAGGAGAGCSSSGSSAAPSTYLPREQMLSPTTCANCHRDHFNDWFGSMHAQAADDPVFIAMNKRGQRETDGGLGTFCVKCHAPMAVRDGKTTNGLNLADLPDYYKGVTCFFCHSIDSVGTDHNNASVNLSDDLVMRGEYSDPVANPAHASAYSTFHDDQQRDNATMCGSCHDIASPAGGHIERTFLEWSSSAFSQHDGGDTCSAGGCHMTKLGMQIPIATGGPKRNFHAHNFPAVDISLQTSTEQATSGPGTLAEGGESDGTSPTDATGTGENGEPTDAGASPQDSASAVDAGAPADAAASGASAADGGLPPGTVAVQNALNSTVLAGALCLAASGGIRVVLDTTGVGHQWPTGAAQDRRAWAEVIAYGDDGNVIYSSGVVPDGTPVTSTVTKDPDLWLLRDCMYDAQNKPVPNFWEAANTNGYELPILKTFLRTDPAFYMSHVVQSFPRDHSALKSRPARITLRMRIQPVGLDVLNDLVASKDLDPSVVGKMPTFDVSLQGPGGGPGLPPPGGLVWTPASNDTTYTDTDDVPSTCAASSGFNPVQAYPAQSAATCTPPSN